jgi:hypothetical protein
MFNTGHRMAANESQMPLFGSLAYNRLGASNVGDERISWIDRVYESKYLSDGSGENDEVGRLRPCNIDDFPLGGSFQDFWSVNAGDLSLWKSSLQGESKRAPYQTSAVNGYFQSPKNLVRSDFCTQAGPGNTVITNATTKVDLFIALLTACEISTKLLFRILDLKRHFGP